MTDGRSPAPRAVGDLLVALRRAGATTVSPPCCAECGKHLRTFQRRGRDWYCSVCAQPAEPCSACGNTRRISSRDRAGQPRCAQCPDTDDRDPITVVHNLVAGLDPHADRETTAAAVHRSAPRPSYRQKLAWALEDRPSLLTGEGHLAPLRAIPRLIDLLHAAGIAGIVRPTCPRCHRVVRIDKPLDGMRVCRTCVAHSRIEECARCAARREPVTRDDRGRPLCANCFTTDPANRETCTTAARVPRTPGPRRTLDGRLGGAEVPGEPPRRRSRADGVRPPGGTTGLTARHPLVSAKANLLLSLRPFVATPALVRELFFPAGTPQQTVDACVEHLQDESYPAYLDTMVFALARPRGHGRS